MELGPKLEMMLGYSLVKVLDLSLVKALDQISEMKLGQWLVMKLAQLLVKALPIQGAKIAISVKVSAMKAQPQATKLTKIATKRMCSSSGVDAGSNT